MNNSTLSLSLGRLCDSRCDGVCSSKIKLILSVINMKNVRELVLGSLRYHRENSHIYSSFFLPAWLHIPTCELERRESMTSFVLRSKTHKLMVDIRKKSKSAIFSISEHCEDLRNLKLKTNKKNRKTSKLKRGNRRWKLAGRVFECNFNSTCGFRDPGERVYENFH